MSMWTPMEPDLGREDDGIPAADPGAGAPPTAEGFGVGGEDPDRLEEADPQEADPQGADPQGADPQEAAAQGADTAGEQDPPFRTPNPGEVGRG